MIRHPMIAAASALLLALVTSCVARPAAAPVAAGEQSILAGSTPADGAVVRGPIDDLVLRFNPPARLDQVVVTGPGGTMPMIIDAVGELGKFTVPTSGLDAGAYRVDWRATAAGQEHRGSFAFTVR
ncbi:MAG: copper resistance CopC family protein [Sphingomicrobium sp.]